MSVKSPDQDIQVTPLTNFSPGLKGFWHWPTLIVARFTLLSYVRSGWILGDVAIVWAIYAAFFLEFGNDVAYFYGTASQALGALSILGTVVMVQRAMSAQVYLPLSRMTSRAAYIRGLIIATAIVRILCFLMLLLLALLFHSHSNSGLCTPVCIQGATVGNISAGAIGLLANCLVLSTLIVAFSAPIASRLARIGLLAWFAIVLYSNTSPDPVAVFLSISHIVLIPMAACYDFGIAGMIDGAGIFSLLLVVLYIVGLTLLAQFWMRRRDLLLH